VALDSEQQSPVSGDLAADLDLRRLVDALADPVVAAGTDNRIVYVNAALEHLLGWTRADLIGAPVTTLMPPRYRAEHLNGFSSYLRTGKSKILGRPVRVSSLSKGGHEIDIELTLAAVSLGDGRTVFVASMRDLRERAELERQLTVTRYLRAANAAASELSSRLDIDHVANTVVEHLVSGFDAALARIWLYDPETNTLHLRASSGPVAPMASASVSPN